MSAPNLPSTPEENAIDQSSVERVITLMRKEYGRVLTLDEMAHCAFYSPYHFIRIFQSQTGVSPTQFLAAIRFEKAKEHLIHTNLDISTISSSIGYSSLSTFTRRFREYVGTSPMQFRKQNRDESVIEPLLDQLPAVQPSSSNLDDSSPYLYGNIIAPESFKGYIFLGLFEHSQPRGAPCTCQIVKQHGKFKLSTEKLSAEKYYLFALGVSRYNPGQVIFTDSALRARYDSPIYLGQCTERTSSFFSQPLMLRKKLKEDPPVSISMVYLIKQVLKTLKTVSASKRRN